MVCVIVNQKYTTRPGSHNDNTPALDQLAQTPTRGFLLVDDFNLALGEFLTDR